MTLQDIDGELRLRVATDRKLAWLRRKIAKAGTATFKDTAAYSERISNLLGETLSEYITDIPVDKRVEVCEWLLRNYYKDINEKLATVQRVLDEADGIRLAPQKPSFPAERVSKVSGALTDVTAAVDVIRRRANAPVANVSKSFHDDYMKRNAQFRSDAGLQCYINREAASGCCKWCTEIAGRYECNADLPEDVYRRHDNCSCTVTYENGRMRQDVWSKRQWEAPESDGGAEPPTVFNEENRPAGFQPKVLTGGEKPDIIKLPDIKIFRSVGAKARNYDIVDPRTGEIFRLAEGSKITNAQVFAGKGTRSPLHDGVAEGLTEQYGGKVSEWQHVKGHGVIDYYGEEIGAEIHWFQEPSVGKVKFKVKEWDE